MKKKTPRLGLISAAANSSTECPGSARLRGAGQSEGSRPDGAGPVDRRGHGHAVATRRLIRLASGQGDACHDRVKGQGPRLHEGPRTRGEAHVVGGCGRVPSRKCGQRLDWSWARLAPLPIRATCNTTVGMNGGPAWPRGATGALFLGSVASTSPARPGGPGFCRQSDTMCTSVSVGG